MSFHSLVLRAAVATCILAAAVSGRAAGPLSLDEAIRHATARSRQLDAHNAAAAAARERAVAAGQPANPVLKIGINNLPVTGADRYRLTPDFMTMRSVGVMQEITRADKLKSRAGRFEREADAALAGSAVALAQLRRDTALAWLDLLYQQRMAALLRGLLAESALQVTATDTAYSVGRGSQADSFVARSAVAHIEDRLHQSGLLVAAATTRLERWVGSSAHQTLGAAPPLAVTQLDSGTLEAHLEHHPKIQLMMRLEALAQAEVQVAQTARLSDWSVELMFSQRGPAYSNMLSVNLSIPLQWDQKNRQDREVAARLALLEQLRAEREEASRDHLAQARAWLQQWRGNQRRMENYDATLVPLAAQRTQASIAAYRGGGGTLLAALQARQAEIDVQLDRLKLEMETSSLWAQLEYLLASDGQKTVPATNPRESQP